MADLFPAIFIITVVGVYNIILWRLWTWIDENFLIPNFGGLTYKDGQAYFDVWNKYDRKVAKVGLKLIGAWVIITALVIQANVAMWLKFMVWFSWPVVILLLGGALDKLFVADLIKNIRERAANFTFKSRVFEKNEPLKKAVSPQESQPPAPTQKMQKKLSKHSLGEILLMILVGGLGSLLANFVWQFISP
jgi:hypothetical protein